MSVARETVQQSYLSAGRPDAYQEDDIHYVSEPSSPTAAAVDGIIVRERPRIASTWAGSTPESLILAETGNSIGAIQIAGTARPPQLPFFVAACDYTLIGEELFAASAYLSKEPRMLGSLKGQDAGKGIAIVFILAGSALATLESITGSETVQGSVANRPLAFQVVPMRRKIPLIITFIIGIVLVTGYFVTRGPFNTLYESFSDYFAIITVFAFISAAAACSRFI